MSPVGAGEIPQRGKSSGACAQGRQRCRHMAHTEPRHRGGDPGTHPIPGEGAAVLVSPQ